MSEPQLAEILARLVVNGEKQAEWFAAQQKQLADQQAAQHNQIADLLQNIKEPQVTVEFKQPPPENNVIRAEKI